MIGFGKCFLSCLIASVAMLPVGAIAQDVAHAPVPVEAPPPAATASFDVSFGVSLTSDYISRGITNSANDLAVQGYIEPSYGWAYLNVWSSNVDYGEDFRGAEIDVALGVRPEFGPMSFDLGYVHYFYTPEDVSPDYGELFGVAQYNFKDMVALGTKYFLRLITFKVALPAPMLRGG